jgi:hypothetical protein
MFEKEKSNRMQSHMAGAFLCIKEPTHFSCVFFSFFAQGENRPTPDTYTNPNNEPKKHFRFFSNAYDYTVTVATIIDPVRRLN